MNKQLLAGVLLAACLALPVRANDVMDNAQVVQMVDLGLGTGVIQAKITASPTRFDTSPNALAELKREIGDITPKSLTAVLRELEKDGVVERRVTPIVPPRVDYALTDLGRSLLGPIDALASWAVENQQAVAEARKRFLDNTAAE